ncbi:uncharacterized protein G2W53_003158 [Senna tora]|uniref:Uncharacterized protein n=1 Tax=Senna tora TaxID=362788 RepID=A0A834XA24_9FABA|nr:uncharacterized protein G2W53_003158 [Senna tora]
MKIIWIKSHRASSLPQSLRQIRVANQSLCKHRVLGRKLEESKKLRTIRAVPIRRRTRRGTGIHQLFAIRLNNQAVTVEHLSHLQSLPQSKSFTHETGAGSNRRTTTINNTSPTIPKYDPYTSQVRRKKGTININLHTTFQRRAPTRKRAHQIIQGIRNTGRTSIHQSTCTSNNFQGINIPVLKNKGATLLPNAPTN